MELRDSDLLLRPFTPADAAALATALEGDDEIPRFIPRIPVPFTLVDAEAWVARCIEVCQGGESHPFAIVDGGSGALLGTVEYHGPGRSVGYWITAAARNRGIATRAVRLVAEWVAERPLRLTTHPENLASQRVAEKAGFRRVGTVPHLEFRDGTAEAVLFELD